jgi:hypothetical protein
MSFQSRPRGPPEVDRPVHLRPDETPLVWASSDRESEIMAKMAPASTVAPTAGETVVARMRGAQTAALRGDLAHPATVQEAVQ